MAFRSARLAAELSGEVERLARRTDDLAESRRRLINAGDAERSRLERAIDRQVAPHLAPLPGQLRRLSVARARTDDAAVTRLIADRDARLDQCRAGGAARDHPGRVPGAAHPGRPAGRTGLPRRDEPAATGRLVVEESAAARRFSPRVEAAAYFCAAEATRDLDDPVLVLAVEDDVLRLVTTGVIAVASPTTTSATGWSRPGGPWRSRWITDAPSSRLSCQTTPPPADPVRTPPS